MSDTVGGVVVEPALFENHLRPGSLKFPSILVQGVTHIAPAIGLVLSIQYIALQAGTAAPLAFLVAFLIILMLGISLTQLAKHNPSAGGYYTYILRTIHPKAGFLTAWVYFLYDPASTAINLAFMGYFLQNTLNPEAIDAEPTPAETQAAIGKLVQDLSGAAHDLGNPAAVQARRLASVLAPLVDAPPATLDEAQDVLIAPLKTTLRQVRSLLAAEQVSIGNLPAALKKTWMSTDGRVRMEVAPKGDGNDNTVLRRFVTAVRSVAPEAAGMPVFTIEAAASVVKAFLQAGVLSVLAIALILFVALRRWIDVALTLIPLLIAIVVTLEVCVLISLPLNFANIIALPLLLGVGVAFKIYYIIAWRSGETNFLQSSLTRAVFFSACTTATAFGSLWFSHHPGTSSMGKLMALSLLTTLAAAVIFQPALLATQQKRPNP